VCAVVFITAGSIKPYCSLRTYYACVECVFSVTVCFLGP